MAVKSIEDDAHFQSELSQGGARLVVVDFTATWCGPCQKMAPIFQQLSIKYANAIFLKVDVDKCQDTAASQGVSAMPTFIFYRLKTKIDKVQGADPTALENKIKQYYSEGEGNEGEGVGGHYSPRKYSQDDKCCCILL